MPAYYRERGDIKQIFIYILRKCDDYEDHQYKYLKEEEKKLDLCPICTKFFKCKSTTSNMLKIKLETDVSRGIKEIDKTKVDGTSFGEKKAFTIPWNATVVNVNIIDEDHRPLVTESLHEKFSQLECLHETRPGMEGNDDTTELAHQYICLMLIVYTLYSSTVRQPFLR